MSLYHQYRPKTLDEIKGNEDIVNTIRGLLSDKNKIPHVWFFHGNTGCGKTTFGRVLKNELNISDNDFREINSSDFRGIDTIRELIKSCGFKPLESTYRMFLLDEVHKLTNDAQNAMLKLLEDTPKHVILVLCTTEPPKLLDTVKNRCQQFQVKPLDDRNMKRLLKGIIRKENESLDQEIMEQIISESLGHPRSAIQMLEQVLNTTPEKRLVIAKQSAVLISECIELSRALFKGENWTKVKEILNGLKGQEAEGIRRQVLGYVQAVLLKTDNPRAAFIMEEFIEPFYHTGFPQLVLACYILTAK